MQGPPGSRTPGAAPEGPAEVAEYAAQAVDYVRRALGVALEYDSETLPLLDHYLRSVPGDKAAAAHLVAATAGAYFGEVVRRRLGGVWDLPSSDPGNWRLVLPSGLWFFPAAMALAAIRGPDADGETDPGGSDGDLEHTETVASDWDASLMAPPALRGQVARVLAGMADVTSEEYYSLCGRLDTLEHVQAVLVAAAAERRRDPS